MPDTQSLRQWDPVVATADDAVTFTLEQILDPGPARPALAKVIDQACRQHGFFYVQIERDVAVMQNAVQQARHFFSLPDTDACKTEAAAKGNGYGWNPMFSEPAYQPGTSAKMESIDFGRDMLLRPDDYTGWQEMPAFEAGVLDSWRLMSRASSAVLDRLSDAAGMPPGFLRRACSSRELDTLRLIHYPGERIGENDRAVGISAHTDFECITLIYQSAAGLELRDPEGRWLDASQCGSRLVVILGDMLERFTNGTYEATGHRVRNTDQERFSIVLFRAVDDSIKVRPVPPFTSPDRPPAYEGVVQGPYIEQQIRLARQNG